MKILSCNVCSSHVWIYILIAPFLFSCVNSKWIVPSEYIGNWESDKNKITIRYKHNLNDDHSKFISDSAIIKIEINEDKTVTGLIGLSAIDSGQIVKSWSFPGLKYAEYQLECSLTGKIFENDPLEAKKVDIWLTFLNESGKLKADIRSGGSNFPMGLMLLEKVKK